MNLQTTFFVFCLALCYSSSIWATDHNPSSSHFNLEEPYLRPIYTLQDTLPPLKERQGNYLTTPKSNPFDLKDPKAIEQKVEYDPKMNLYIITEKVNGSYYRPPVYMTQDEYFEWRSKQENKTYFKELSIMNQGDNVGGDPILPYKDRVAKSLAERLFCGSSIDVRPTGNIDLTFGLDYQKLANPILTERQQSQPPAFNFDMNIQLNVIGKIGQKVQLAFNYNTQATFDFDRQIKVEYLTDTECSEDDILKKIEAGNVSFPLPTSLISGRQNLFGFRTDLQFGRLKTSFVLSQSQTKRKEMQIEGGAQLQNFEVSADNYDENRHFFLSHYNRNTYEKSLENLPQVNTLFNITKIEVWVTNNRNVTQGVRDIVAYADLGETDATKMIQGNWLPPVPQYGYDLYNNPLPDNDANTLYQELLANSGTRALQSAVSSLQTGLNMEDSKDFTKLRARKLNPSEYSFHPQLGFLSLNLTMRPTDVVAVAYQYTYNGKTYQVGEFAQDLPVDADTLNVMHLKMLKGVRTRVDLPIWDLMMKNVYSLGAYQINEEDFYLDLLYQDPGGGEKRFIPTPPIDGNPLLRLFNLDNLNRARDPIPDGQFDFVPGITILPQNGRLIFPVLEPFGSALEREFEDPNNPGSILPNSQKYVYHQLYDSTIFRAREFPEFNRFVIRGRYKSSVSSEISLGGFNIPKGSVTVSAGGRTLTEGTDYTIDYNLGRIKVINESYLNSGQPIRVSFEDNSTFGFTRQGFYGTRLDYAISKNFNVGGTFLHLNERPFTQKVNYGEDPISNSIYGFDFQYSNEAPWLTRLIDKLPLISTKAPSSIALSGEFAHLLPGSPNVINQGDDIGGVVYIDDFEGSASNFNLTIPATNWVLASTPRNNGLFSEADLVDNLDYNKNRAKLSWYTLEPTLIEAEEGIYTRQIQQQELFKNLTLDGFQFGGLRTFDLTYYPEERGPYNYSLDNIDPATGNFTDPENRWAGIMRPLQNNDFEASNIEFVEVWMMSPFADGQSGAGGELYIELGDVSEDILRDSRLFFENGISEDTSINPMDESKWSLIPRTQAVTRAFDNDPAIRDKQDVGLDGVNDEDERIRYQDYLDSLGTVVGVTSDAYLAAEADPSNDNFIYYRDEVLDSASTIINRYKFFNNPQGNSSTDPNSTATTISTSTNIPDTEDINKDNSLNEEESYFQYHIPIKPTSNSPNGEIENTVYTTDTVVMEYEEGGNTKSVVWYQFKIPIDQFSRKVGGISDFRSIRFMRMYMTGFDKQTTLRFGRLDLVRNQWRRYLRSLALPGAFAPSENNNQTKFDVSAVNIEENSLRSPFNYTLPPGVQREQAIGSINNAQQNEQSQAIIIQNLEDGDARGIFKNINMDLRVYERLKMHVHAEDIVEGDCSQENEIGDMSLFVRIGSDFESNFYEYEIPLTMSNPTQAGNESDPEQIWLEENRLDIPLKLLREVKMDRDANSGALNLLYEITDSDNSNNKVKVIGNPDLGMVKSIMIGVRNRKDDGLARCIELWVNELRLTGFDERGGTAAIASMNVQLADLGAINASGSFQSIGFGSIEQKVNQRSREQLIQYDVSGNLNIDKLFPEKWKLKVPFYAQYSQEISTPEYDPFQLDIPLKEKLLSFTNRAERDSARRQAQTVRTISSFNFTNVRKERTSKFFPLPIDISNFSFTYAQSSNQYRSPLVEFEEKKENRGIIDYKYAPGLKPIYPFKKLFKKRRKWLALVQDFNFMPLFNNFSFRNELRRDFTETTYRFAGDDATWYDKKFSWNRDYNLQWNLARSLKFNFTARNSAIIDEPYGKIDNAELRQQVLDEVLKFGRNKNYQHNFNVSYNIPLSKIPLLDWINSKAQYSASYSWTVASLNMDTLGNVIQNTQKRQLSADFNFRKLYSKSKYLKKIEAPKRKNPKKKGEKKPAKKDPKDKKKDKKDKKKNKNREPSSFERMAIRPLLLIRRARINYNENFSSVVPGVMSQSKYLGMDGKFQEPGLDFILGWQPDASWLENAAQRNQISKSIFLNQQVVQTHKLSYSGQLTLEPVKNFKIDVDVKKDLTENYSETFKMDEIGGSFQHMNAMRMGSVTMTYLPIRTFMDKQGSSGQNSSVNFETFENNRLTIAQRIAAQNGDTTGHDDQLENPNYPEGYGKYQQDVLIPAFLAAYNGEDANTISLGDIRDILPMPNWKVSYNGLSKIKGLDKIFSSFSLSHGYKSTLTVNSFATDLDFQEDPEQKDVNSQNYYSRFEIPDIVISEQFNPLIGVDMRFKNDISANFKYSSSRTLSMSFIDNQLSEQKSTNITAGFGWRIKNVKPETFTNLFRSKKNKKKKEEETGVTTQLGQMDFNLGFGKTIPKHELEIKFDFSFRDDKTVNHILDQDQSVATRGTKTISLSPTINYMLNNRLTFSLFFDYRRTIPAVSTSFPMTAIKSGVTIRFSLGQ